MKIYIVMMDDWNMSHCDKIYGIYSSKERADKVAEEANKNMDNIEYYVIEGVPRLRHIGKTYRVIEDGWWDGIDKEDVNTVVEESEWDVKLLNSRTHRLYVVKKFFLEEDFIELIVPAKSKCSANTLQKCL